jgi:hypothetical protein
MSGVALNASAAWKTMATELVKPTKTATKPAVKADGLKSLKKRMGGSFVKLQNKDCGSVKTRTTNGPKIR